MRFEFGRRCMRRSRPDGAILEEEGRRGWGFGRHGGHGRHGGRGGRGVFDSAELRLALLKLIAEQPRHGYDVIRAIEEKTGGSYAPSPGVVYPAIAMLADMNLITESQSDGARKVFAITSEGEAELEANRELVEMLFERLGSLAQARGRMDDAPVRRAIENLRNVLRGRLSGDDADREFALKVATILDEAAQKVERL